MDRLESIFELQKSLNSKIERERNLNFSRDEWIQKEIMAMGAELAEVLEEVNYKWWKNEKEINDEKLHEEIIDVLHFFVSLCLHAGLDADKLYDVYLKKNAENIRRQDGLSDKEGYKPEKK